MVFMDEVIHSAPWRQGMKSSLVPVALLQTTMQRDGNTYRKTFLFCSIVADIIRCFQDLSLSLLNLPCLFATLHVLALSRNQSTLPQ
jgi:hypothetical protein